MEWLADPTAWLGLFTLIILEIVLGIDNLVFIAVLADKLPPHQRDRARIIGMSLALVMRLLLLASIAWLAKLTEPLFDWAGFSPSGRDLILLIGGLFLLFKATMELHERLEGRPPVQSRSRVYAGFGAVVTQIVILDAVFSLDSVITAVGMVDELSIMMIAVIIAILLMMLASKPLTAFVLAHPTLVVLCLGFLLMIGFSLVAEGLGFHIPKGYLYAAIGFSVLIETLNQVARANRRRFALNTQHLRERTLDTVMRLLGARPHDEPEVHPEVAPQAPSATPPPFGEAERGMIKSVLRLAEQPVQNLMTPRAEIAWLDLQAPPEELLRVLQQHPYSRLLVAEDELDNLKGIVQSRDLLTSLLRDGTLQLPQELRQPLIVPENASALQVLESLKDHPIPLAVVVDEYGSVEGLVTTGDLLAAIAGELVDTRNSDQPPIQTLAPGVWLLDGALALDDLKDILGGEAMPEAGFHTLAGLVLHQLQRLPQEGDAFEWEGHRFEVCSMQGRRVTQVRLERQGD